MTGKEPRVFVRPPTAQAAVLAELRLAILHGELAPGTPILQEAVAEEFGVSRVPVREALKILEGEGRVQYLPQRGYSVTKLAIEDLREIYRVRQLLEVEAVRTGVARLTGADILAMSKLVRAMDEAADAGDLVALTTLNRQFHFRLIEASNREWLISIIRQLWDSTDPYRSVYFAESANRKTIQREHRAILKATRQRDADLLIQLLDEHRQHAVGVLTRALEESE
ncbi:GntR family transcriptional regulator [Streptomyces sp. 110]|uniref:GntR family transcriptional regulator n=1 Tax=Streptomyces endocoffeicus TaxID=2898945 RepID=A0ABS1PVJ1_9ACTN|nr:GntR family transcriptional regulator [Streptomyces endocoffeicus]MBL1116446.1 GntR family transcriptional regulator [Streptomyces endocoffeicus]